jgi:alkanesulfonate monooxygenase SsuD/methylene tetrahydromethanopterin reductase-like flavin-dependent oxidoreductase (luciferase family)
VLGYATFAVADHFATQYAPMPLLQYVADHTSRIRLATLVLNNDFRHPTVLAKEAATLDVLSGGRLELGLGAGWLLQEYRQAGIAFQDGPPVRRGWKKECTCSRRASRIHPRHSQAASTPCTIWMVAPSLSSAIQP